MALNRLNYKPCGTEIPAWTRATGFITSHGCDIAHRTFLYKIQGSRPTFIKLASRVIYEIRVTFLWNPDLPRYWVAIVLKGICRYSHYYQMWLYMRLIVFRWSARLKLDIFFSNAIRLGLNFWDFVWQTEVSLVLLMSLSIIDFPRKKNYYYSSCRFRNHDDVIKWKHFPRYWSFVRGFPSQRPATRTFDVFFDLCLNKRLSKQSRRRWFETASGSSWRQCNVLRRCCGCRRLSTMYYFGKTKTMI